MTSETEREAWYVSEYQKFRAQSMKDSREAEALRREVATLKEALEEVAKPLDIPAWKRIANQRRAIRFLEHNLEIWKRMYYREKGKS